MVDSRNHIRRVDDDDDLFIPQDVIEEILLKLPVKSLMKFKYVSKYFFNLITSPTFVYQHLHHSTSQLNNHLVLISSFHTHKSYICSNNYRPKELRHCSWKFSDTNDLSNPDVVDIHLPNESNYTVIRSACNGLLHFSILTGGGRSTECILNPCTKEYKKFSPPLFDQELEFLLKYKPSSNGFCGFGYDRTNDAYKVLCFESYKGTNSPNVPLMNLVPIVFYTDFSCITEFKVCTVVGRTSTTTWRSIECDNYMTYRLLCFRRGNSKGLFVNGAIHWIMLTKDPKFCHQTAKVKIISFDVEKEKFGEIHKPQSILEEEDEHYLNLQVLRGCLCMCQVGKGSDGIDVWMLKDYTLEDSWTKLFTVAESNLYSEMDFQLLRYCENGEIVIVRDQERIVVYDPLNRKARHVEKLKELDLVAIFSVDETIHVESLVSLNTFTYYWGTGRRI